MAGFEVSTEDPDIQTFGASVLGNKIINQGSHLPAHPDCLFIESLLVHRLLHASIVAPCMVLLRMDRVSHARWSSQRL